MTFTEPKLITITFACQIVVSAYYVSQTLSSEIVLPNFVAFPPCQTKTAEKIPAVFLFAIDLPLSALLSEMYFSLIPPFRRDDRGEPLRFRLLTLPFRLSTCVLPL